MGNAVKVFLLTLSALFPIVDPLAGSPIFLAMTQDYASDLVHSVFLSTDTTVDRRARINLSRRYLGSKPHPPLRIPPNDHRCSAHRNGAVAISVLLCYGLADRLGRVIGKTGMIVIVRLSSFLLVCIGVQIMWNGIDAHLATLHI